MRRFYTAGLASTRNEGPLELRNPRPGVPADEVGRIFEAFYQLRRGDDGAREGVGPRLAIVKRL